MGAKFSAPIKTGPEAHSASCTMRTGSFPGVKQPGRGADHPPPSKCRGQERVELYLYSLSGPPWPVMGAPLPRLICIYMSYRTVNLQTLHSPVFSLQDAIYFIMLSFLVPVILTF